MITRQADALKRFRRNLNLSQKDLGDHLGVNPQYISNMERSLAPVPPEYTAWLVDLANGSRAKWIKEFKKAYLRDQEIQWNTRFLNACEGE
jgi:transcriptional regulator with XRE-family HTH domain